MKYQAYSEYKDSGVEWLGDVPFNWKVKKLKYICKVQTGSKDTVNAIDDGSYPFFVRSQTVERINSIGADCEAVLTAGDGVGVGKVFHYFTGKFDYHQRVYMLNNFANVLGRFVFYYLSNNFYKVALEGNAKSTVDSLRLPQFLNFEFSLPTIDVQAKIVCFLDHETTKIDTLIEKQQQLIQLLKEKRQAVISHAVTKGLNPDAPMKDSGVEWLGEVPEHWITGRLIYQVNLLVDGTHHSPESYPVGDYLYITAKNIKEHGYDFSNISYISSSDHDEIYARCSVKKDDVLYIKDGATAGIAMINNLEEEFSLLSSVAVIRPRKDIIRSQYLKHHLNASAFKDEMLNRLRGGAMTRFTLDGISRFNIIIPPLEDQDSIIKFIEANAPRVDSLIEKAIIAISLMKERRTTLISAAVTGKIDVRNWVDLNKESRRDKDDKELSL